MSRKFRRLHMEFFLLNVSGTQKRKKGGYVGWYIFFRKLCHILVYLKTHVMTHVCHNELQLLFEQKLHY